MGIENSSEGPCPAALVGCKTCPRPFVLHRLPGSWPSSRGFARPGHWREHSIHFNPIARQAKLDLCPSRHRPPATAPWLCIPTYGLYLSRTSSDRLRMCHCRDNLPCGITPPCCSLRRVLSLTLLAHITPHDVYPPRLSNPSRASGNWYLLPTGQHRQGCSRCDETTGQIMAALLNTVQMYALRAKDQHQVTRLAKRHVPLTSSPHP
ncbi:hypothetical protein LX32DRAFT_219252 [Colletotrichum zoysiae]|uniref:Uncharacterized protein n=1 Tax=Colletotrichum zoysiae TaxID=1216348 RepID=A0AAD9HPS0_9PEZI|nr:hypothetical protein LX32DRAFT_219252 [Colletotrichum zoysiae]